MGTRRAAWKEEAPRDLEHLNELLLASCKEEEQRIIAGREQTIGAAMAIEREHLQPVPREGFDLAAVSFPKVISHLLTPEPERFLALTRDHGRPPMEWSSAVTIVLEISEEIAHCFVANPDAVSRAVLEALAIEGDRSRKLTTEQVRWLLGFAFLKGI